MSSRSTLQYDRITGKVWSHSRRLIENKGGQLNCVPTHLPAVVSGVVEEQFLVRQDLGGGAEEQLAVVRVGHQVLFLTGPAHRTSSPSRFNIILQRLAL